MHRLRGEGSRLKKTAIRWLYSIEQEQRLRSGTCYQLGYTYPQAITSALPVLALDIRPGQSVLDLCAAPGGKTTHMAQIMGDTGIVVANDRKHGRITALMANLKRLGITNTVVTNCRGEFLATGMLFNRVLVDAPCSGEGRYRLDKNGRLTHMKAGATDLPAIQKGLVQKGYDLLAPGGIMVYSTCTINPDENEAVINHLLRKRGAVLEPWQPPLAWHRGVTDWNGVEYDKNLRFCRRFYAHETGSVGFFLARIRKL